MNILIVPYEGQSDKLTQAFKKYNISTPKCDNGKCPIPKPLKMLDEEKLKEHIKIKLQNMSSIGKVDVLALDEIDLKKLKQMNLDKIHKKIKIIIM